MFAEKTRPPCRGGVVWHIKGVLSPEQERDGFSAFEDEHFVYIRRFDEICLAFYALRATRESLQKAVEELRSRYSP